MFNIGTQKVTLHRSCIYPRASAQFNSGASPIAYMKQRTSPTHLWVTHYGRG